jgi:hypothetical protein
VLTCSLCSVQEVFVKQFAIGVMAFIHECVWGTITSNAYDANHCFFERVSGAEWRPSGEPGCPRSASVLNLGFKGNLFLYYSTRK